MVDYLTIVRYSQAEGIPFVEAEQRLTADADLYRQAVLTLYAPLATDDETSMDHRRALVREFEQGMQDKGRGY